jgi:hypothetical protein
MIQSIQNVKIYNHESFGQNELTNEDFYKITNLLMEKMIKQKSNILEKK